ncbi:MAG: PQQ-binding-like beta-propeller repeat protein [Anaerolineae bacterium]|nr:PQQ-binding-like beta-propeller repeat protein [Anaerolineae bacterium]
MNIVKSLAQRPLLAVAVMAGVLSAACVPIRQEASWPAVSIIGDEQDILVAYQDRVVLINPEDGTPVKLRNSDGEVRLDEEGNARVWEFTGPEGQSTQFYSTPAQLNDETLLIPSFNDLLFEVGLKTARADKNAAGVALPGPVVSNPVLHDNRLYMGLSERELVALSQDGTTVEWRFTTGHGVWSQPLIIDNVLYFGSLDHFLYAVNATTGDELWKLDLQGAVTEAPAYYEGNLYVGSFARKVLKISLDGEVLAEYKTNDWVWNTPSIVDGVLYAADMGGAVYALDISGRDFQQVWQAQVTNRAIRTTPLVKNEYVIVGSRDKKLYWLNREDGSTFFSRELSDEALSDFLLIEPSDTVNLPEPIIVAGTPSTQELLVAFTLQSGERVWTYGR